MEYPEYYLLMGTFVILLVVGVLTDIFIRIAQMLGFGDDQKVSYKLDKFYKELEGGQAINVKEYFNET